MANLSIAFACPHFVEFFSDPKDVSDREGEFVEIRLDDFWADSLTVQMDDKVPIAFAYPSGSRLVLVHDSLFCPKIGGTDCALLDKQNLPNSRETSWLMRAGSCTDSITLPSPKAGVSLQRVGEGDSWVYDEPTKGFANPAYERGVKDCALEPVMRTLIDSSNLGVWRYDVNLSGCDSSNLILDVVNFMGGEELRDSFFVKGNFHFESRAAGLWIRGALPDDEAPGNNFLDTLIFERGPLAISEIHHCPAEPEPEWVEVYNRSGVALPLEKFRFCNRGTFWGMDSIAPHETMILTKDTSSLREILGFKDVRLLQSSFGYLNNASGCISICYGEIVVDSVCWDKHTVGCPAGFNPMTMAMENTPGFVRADVASGASLNGNDKCLNESKNAVPFTYKLSSRVVRQNGNPLRVYVESDSPVKVRLLDSTGRERWQKEVPGFSNAWWNVPLADLTVGVAYISLAVGKFENVVGILIRP